MNIYLDAWTLLVSVVVVNFCMTIILLFFRMSQKTYPGYGFWLAGSVFACLSYALFALRGILPDVFTIPLANTLGILVGVSRLEGVRRFVGETGKSIIGFALSALTFAVFSYFTFAWDDSLVRNLLFSVIVVIIALRISWVLHRNREKTSRPIARFMIGLMLSFSLLFIIRAAFWVVFPETRGMFFASPANSFAYLLGLFFDVNWAVGFILLNNHRLNAEVKDLGKKLAQLNQGIEQSPASVVITDLQGCIEYVNPYFSELTGYSREEVIGKSTRILKSGQTLPATYREMWETIKSGHPWRGEFLTLFLRKYSAILFDKANRRHF